MKSKRAAGTRASTTKPSPADLKALMRAIELGLESKVNAALAKCPSVNVVVPMRYGGTTTPLRQAVRSSNRAIVAALLGAGADALQVDEDARTVLHDVRDATVAALLVRAGADPNARDASERTPLHDAVDNVDVTRFLLAEGADVDAKDEKGRTPYVLSSNHEVRAVLREYGSKGLPIAEGRILSPKKSRKAANESRVNRGALGVDALGNVWMGGNGTIGCFDGKALTRFDFEESFSVDAVASGPKGTVYFATNWGLVTVVDGKWRLFGSEDSEIHDSHLTDMFVDGRGRAHVLGYESERTVDRTISVFDGKRFLHMKAGSGIPEGLELTCLAFDEEDRPIFGTANGVVWSDGKTWAVKGKLGRASEVRTLTASGDVLWVGSRDGVYRLRGTEEERFETNGQVSVACRAGDALWVGLSYGGLLRIDDSGARTEYKAASSALPNDDVDGLALGADGTVWIAAGGKIAWVRDGVLCAFDGTAPTSAGAASPVPKPEPVAAARPKKRKLAPIPKVPFVPLAKLPKFVVDGVRSTKLEGVAPEALLRFVRPAIGFQIGKATPKAGAPVGSSKLGGRPDLPDGVAWPTYEDDEDRMLPFLLQVNIGDIAKLDVEGLLPKKGLLSFFAETIPDELEQAKVIYSDGAKRRKRRDWPEDLVDRKAEVDFVAQLPERTLSFYAIWTLPSFEYLETFAELGEADREALHGIDAVLRSKAPKRASTTRLLGWPNNLQGEIITSPKQIVLLQLDCSMSAPNGAISTMFSQWGDGLVHFVVGQDDLAKRKLGKAAAMLAYT